MPLASRLSTSMSRRIARVFRVARSFVQRRQENDRHRRPKRQEYTRLSRLIKLTSLLRTFPLTGANISQPNKESDNIFMRISIAYRRREGKCDWWQSKFKTIKCRNGNISELQQLPTLKWRKISYSKFFQSINSAFHWLHWVCTDSLIENSFRAGCTVSVHKNFSGTRLLSVPVGAMIYYAFLSTPLFLRRQPYSRSCIQV